MKWLRLLTSMAATAMVASCTLASGWSDLQGGQPDSGKSGTSGNETGAPDGESPNDDGGSSSGDAGGTGIAVPCGAQTCTGTNGCCVKLGEGSRSCVDHDTCNPGATRRFLLCTHGGQCPSTKPKCCLQFPEWGSTCENGCKAGSDVLCDPARVTQHCAAGETCTAYSSTPDIFSCQ